MHFHLSHCKKNCLYTFYPGVIRISICVHEYNLCFDLICFVRETAWENSPDKFIDQICDHAKGNDVEVLVAAGESDSPEFRRQSKEFTEVGCFHEFISIFRIFYWTKFHQI